MTTSEEIKSLHWMATIWRLTISCQYTHLAEGCDMEKKCCYRTVEIEKQDSEKGCPEERRLYLINYSMMVRF